MNKKQDWDELESLARAGDPVALRELILRWRFSLLPLARKFTRNFAEQEELIAAALRRCASHFPRYRSELGSLHAFWFAKSLRAMQDHASKNRKGGRSPLLRQARACLAESSRTEGGLVEKLAHQADIPYHRAYFYIACVRPPLALDQASSPELLDDEWLDRCPREVCEIRDDVARIKAAVRLLTARQREVITRGYGLDGQPPETLAEMAVRMRISPPAVTQAHQAGIRRLRKLASDPGICREA